MKKAVFTTVASLLTLSSIYAQTNAFTRLDELQPPPGQPICSDWYKQEILPKLGCRPDTIQKICTGQLPKVDSGPFCGALESPSYDTNTMGKTCHTMLGVCPLPAPAPLNAGCYCPDIAKNPHPGRVSKP